MPGTPSWPAPTVSSGTSSKIVTDNQAVSLHTYKGVQLYQFLSDQYSDSTWGRAQRDASNCALTLPPQPGLDRLPDIVPWLHWVSIWDADRDLLLWTGPIQKATSNRAGLSLEAKDHGSLLSRQRNPMTKRWDGADPAIIAGEIWEMFIEQQGLGVHPIIRPDPEGDRYDFQVVTDAQALDKTMTDLVNLGLRWSVVSGIPVIGPVSLKPVAILSEDDFLGDGIDLVRDGSAVYNDVLVRAPNNVARAHVDYYGLNLQAIVNQDDMFTASNVSKAANQYVRNAGSVRTRLSLPSGTQLHPDAPVHIDQLMSSARFVIEAHGIRQAVELTGVEVERRAGLSSVKVTMDSLPDRDAYGNLIELAQDKNAPVVTLGGQAVGR